jgi:hypothetical protein
MAPYEQFIVERPQADPADRSVRIGGFALFDDRRGGRVAGDRLDDRHGGLDVGDERAAREALRTQISKLERELSGLVANAFPHIAPRDGSGERFSGPRLLTLAELERLRDRLVQRVGEVRGQAVERDALERRSRALLERMKLEPGRYKFVRLPVADLGDGHCGVWEVRPRLGLIGMLAGWWQVKLSSGCP